MQYTEKKKLSVINARIKKKRNMSVKFTFTSIQTELYELFYLDIMPLAEQKSPNFQKKQTSKKKLHLEHILTVIFNTVSMISPSPLQ